MNLSQFTTRTGLCATLGIATACMVGPKYEQPSPTAVSDKTPAEFKEVPSHFKDADGWSVARPNDKLMRGDWWKVFGDPELNALEEQLNINNQNIKQFFQNYMVARAMVREATAALWPTLTANGSYTRSRSPAGGSTRTATGSSSTATSSAAGASSSGGGVTSIPSSGGNPVTSILTALEVSWEPDLWGKIRNAIRAAQYNAQLSAGDLENERLSEQASLAMFYFQIRGQDALQKLYNDTIVEDKKALEYTRGQFETGITDKISFVEAQNTLENAEATATNIGVARAQYEHAIAVLIGKAPSSFSVPVKPLQAEAPPIPVGVPSQLLERRPDIAAAERNMASANAQIGVAYAAFFPTLTLGAEGGFTASKFSQLFSASNHLWSFGPSVSETLFDAGLRSATVHQYVATYNANLAAYREAVLTAFQQVEDYLAQVRILSKQLIQQRRAEKSAQEYVKLEWSRYQTGIDPYVNVVTAQNTLLLDQQAVITVQVQEMTGAVQLVKALGGGWDRLQLPSVEDVTKKPTKEETEIQR